MELRNATSMRPSYMLMPTTAEADDCFQAREGRLYVQGGRPPPCARKLVSRCSRPGGCDRHPLRRQRYRQTAPDRALSLRETGRTRKVSLLNLHPAHPASIRLQGSHVIQRHCDSENFSTH